MNCDGKRGVTDEMRLLMDAHQNPVSIWLCFGPLLRRPPLRRSESLRGYLMRLEYENGMPLLTQYLTSLSKASTALPWIEAATKRSAEELQSRVFLTPLYDGKNQQVKIFDCYLHKKYFRLKQKTFCPECLAQTGYMNAAWEFAFVTTCALHGRYLISKCTVCSSTLDWQCGSLFTCICRTDLREMTAAEAPTPTMLLDALAAELISPSEERRAVLLDAELLSLIDNDDEALSKKLKFLFQTFYEYVDDFETLAFRRWLLPLCYARRQQTGRAWADMEEAEKARARNIQRGAIDVINPTISAREATLTDREAREDARTEALESALFQTMLYSYRLDPERADQLYWYRKDWFQDRLRFIKD